MNNLEINNMLRTIYGLISKGCYKEALEYFRNIEVKYFSEEIIRFNKMSILIDIGSGLKREDLILEGINTGKPLLVKDKYKKHEASMNYNIANGYMALFNINEYGKGIEKILLSENLRNAKYYLRKSIECINLGYLKSKQLWVNYGNFLDSIGRGIEALYAYDEALMSDSNFSMAIGNKAKALCYFADISGRYRDSIYTEAYQMLKSIVNKQDLVESGTIIAKQAFERKMHKIEGMVKDKKILDRKIKYKIYNVKKISHFEKYYIEYCSNNKLYLNFHVHNNKCEAAIVDPIFINIVTKIDDNSTFYDLAKYINQIKEDYIIARLLLVQSQYKRTDFNNISKRTIFIYPSDYSQFNLYYGLLKHAFTAAYNILDKIAVFINKYYELGYKEKEVYFRTIWEKDSKIDNKILQSKNISLYALYDIYKDFKYGYNEHINGIRTALTHRKLVIYNLDTGEDIKKEKDNIYYEDMVRETINMLKLAKSAVIYTINFVNLEERKKHKSIKGVVAPMYADTSQFL